MKIDLFEPYRAEHLVLMVGGNPLPNAVAAHLLTRPDGFVTLVHSPETAHVAERIDEWLRSELPDAEVEREEVDAYHKPSVYGAVQDRLEKGGAEVAGLHYTGGTSVMDVHGYRAAEHWSEKNRRTVHFSYLDSTALRLNIDGGRSHAVGLSVEFSLEELMRLHGRSEWNGLSFLTLPGSASQLAQVHGTRAGGNAWREWRWENLRNHKNRNGRWKSDSTLEDVRFVLPESDRFRDLREAMHGELPEAVSEDGRVHVGSLPDNLKPHHFMQWLESTWLEVAVMGAVKRCANALDIHEVRRNVDVFGREEDKNDQFEIDVVAVRGYQVFVFSCTVSTDKKGGKNRIKKRLFEAWARARQVGGTEAPVALVCSAADPGRIEREFLREVGSERRGHVRVFGRKHLPKLDEVVSTWIESRKGD